MAGSWRFKPAAVIVKPGPTESTEKVYRTGLKKVGLTCRKEGRKEGGGGGDGFVTSLILLEGVGLCGIRQGMMCVID